MMHSLKIEGMCKILNHKEKPILWQTNDVSILMRFFFSMNSYKSKTEKRLQKRCIQAINKKINSFIYLANIIYS